MGKQGSRVRVASVAGAVASLMLMAANANAFVVEWGKAKPTEDHTYNLTSGFSVDTIAFKVTTASDITFSGFTTGATFSGALGALMHGNTILTPFDLGPTSGSTTYTDYLAPGNYSFYFDALAIGRGRSLTLDATITPVPEPQTWALMAAGLGVLGLWSSWVGGSRGRDLARVRTRRPRV